jgi:hypothetical protein
MLITDEQVLTVDNESVQCGIDFESFSQRFQRLGCQLDFVEVHSVHVAVGLEGLKHILVHER